MNQDRPSPNDDEPASPTPTEQRLKQVRPRPVTFNAETILDAASASRGQVALPTRIAGGRQSGSGRWLTVAVSWTCGAAAGALLTFLLLTPGKDNSGTTTEGEAKPAQAPEAEFAVIDNSIAPESNIAPERNTSQLPRGRLDLDGPWSRNERLVSARLREMHRPTSAVEPPLMAGNYVRLHSSRRSPVEVATVEEPLGRSDLLDPGATPIETTNSPTLSINPEALLRELLGVAPNSRL